MLKYSLAVKGLKHFHFPHGQNVTDDISTLKKSVALTLDASLQSGLESGMLIAVPIPGEFAASGEIIEDAIQTAIRAAK